MVWLTLALLLAGPVRSQAVSDPAVSKERSDVTAPADESVGQTAPDEEKPAEKEQTTSAEEVKSKPATAKPTKLPRKSRKKVVKKNKPLAAKVVAAEVHAQPAIVVSPVPPTPVEPSNP